MAYPATDYTATWDKTANTFGRSVDSQLWPALMARSPLIAYLPRFTVDHTVFEWETQNEPTRLYTEANDGSTDIEGSATGTTVVFSAGPVEPGMLLKNASKATPIGSYGIDEVMLVTAVSGLSCTVKRDYQNIGLTPGQGSTAHALTNVFECIGYAKEEGSGPGANRYRDVTLASNYTQLMDFHLNVTGSQMASKRLLPADNLAAQTKLGVEKLANEMESMFLYGALNSGANGGNDSYVRTSKGFQQFINGSGSNVDYATKVVTAPALDARFAAIIDDNTDPTDKFIIACHPSRAREMSHFGEDIVRTTQNETVWGREIKTFKSDLGIEADILWTLNCSKSDLFIINLNKVGIAEYRPWMQTEVTYSDDMVDAWRQRVLGEYGFKVVDGLYSHAALQYLTW